MLATLTPFLFAFSFQGVAKTQAQEPELIEYKDEKSLIAPDRTVALEMLGTTLGAASGAFVAPKVTLGTMGILFNYGLHTSYAGIFLSNFYLFSVPVGFLLGGKLAYDYTKDHLRSYQFPLEYKINQLRKEIFRIEKNNEKLRNIDTRTSPARALSIWTMFFPSDFEKFKNNQIEKAEQVNNRLRTELSKLEATIPEASEVSLSTN